ncbi:DNA/RNA non-specific endonuclease [Belnapia sp. T18]|uniref:DNA/RNA non-specific endonuclease n=1 Tax=Belnapia arida TaxID=2804533 RepID=A0ABS1TYP6_9PROT|nr:DNA/RNA non-specific endonuclease [Belnapia arida]MBL6077554.1 DNA/RNA non-specific endonuclease [Belnapia arida]
MEIYLKLIEEIPQPVARDTAFAKLDERLQEIWIEAYPMTGGELLTVTLGGKPGEAGAVSTLFDLQPKGSKTEDRVVAVWGISKSEPANTRDTSRMAGFLNGVWSPTYAGRDRGHFFAHTMGGGTDINLFPQLAAVNRGGEWRRMERFAVENPGTFCFIRPIYRGSSWTPAELEYGIYTMPPQPFRFWGNLFPN